MIETIFLIAFAAGNFIYLALADLIPELHKGVIASKSERFDVFFFILGMGIMAALVVLD